MISRSSLVLLAFSMAGCPEEGTGHDHNVGAQPTLVEGAYSVAILSVQSFDCEADPRNLVGQSLPAYFEGAGDDVSMSVAGFSLSGSLNGGQLSVEGGMGEGGTEPGADEPVYTESGAAAEYEDEDEGREDREDGDVEERERPPEDGPRRVESWMGIEAELYDTETAIGSLFIQVDRCSAEVKVAIAYLGEEQEQPPQTREFEQGEESEGCEDEETDCG